MISGYWSCTEPPRLGRHGQTDDFHQQHYQTLHDICPVTLGLQTGIRRIYSLHLRLHRAVLVLTGLRLRTSARTGTRGVLILGTTLASFGIRCAFCTLLDAAPVVLHALPRLLDGEAAVRLLSFSSSLVSGASSSSVGILEFLQQLALAGRDGLGELQFELYVLVAPVRTKQTQMSTGAMFRR
jgi:hypothetical protein